jgi:hypothetical protein
LKNTKIIEMKGIFFASLILILSSANAQIREIETIKYQRIGRVPANNIGFITSIEYAKDSAANGTNLYIWTYKDLKYTQLIDIKSITFNASESDFNSLYETLKNLITAEKGTEKALMLGQKPINILTSKMMGISSLTIFDLSTGGYFYLTSKQIDQLFGKN